MVLDRAFALAGVALGVLAFLTITGDLTAPAVPLVALGFVCSLLARRVARRRDRSLSLPALAGWLNVLVAIGLGIALLDPTLLGV